MRRNPDSAWTDERVDELIQRAESGEKPAMIAVAMSIGGASFSRNAVIGKLSRLGDLREGACRWIADQRCADGLPMYCGAGTVLGGSWCPEHHQMVFAPAHERRRTA